MKGTLEERFWAKVQKIEGSCWLWIGGKAGPDGYGQIDVDGKMVYAHRISWILHNSDIPNGQLVLHTCDNPPCVHPDHLFLGDHVDNMADQQRKGRNWGLNKIHCINGHEFTPENTYIPRFGHRECRICRKEAKLRYKLSKRNLI